MKKDGRALHICKEITTLMGFALLFAFIFCSKFRLPQSILVILGTGSFINAVAGLILTLVWYLKYEGNDKPLK